MSKLVDPAGHQMLGATFPGNSSVDLGWHQIPTPGWGQALLKTGASGICGSDLANAYRERRDRGARSYTGCIGGHEFAGTIVDTGPGVSAITIGDRVIVYHVAGCGQCTTCRSGAMIHCDSPNRRAYGNQRDGGHAPFVLVDALTCIPAPDDFSAVDAALLGCGFSTAYEGLTRQSVDGEDHVLIVGLGPLGLAAAMVARALGAHAVVGAELSQERRRWAASLGLFDNVICPDDVPQVDHDSSSASMFTFSVDASGADQGRQCALRALRTWGRCAFLGEGGEVTFDVSEYLLHKEITLSGSWVTSVPNMARCAELLATQGMHPERVVEHPMPLHEADRAYQLAASQRTGKVCLVFDR